MQFTVAERLIGLLSQAKSTDDVYEHLARSSIDLGFDHFALSLDLVGHPGCDPSVLLHNYPSNWAEVYVGFDLAATDPIRRAAERSMQGFSWRSVANLIPLTDLERRMFQTGVHHGLIDGFTVPRHLPADASGTCTFAIGPTRLLPDAMLEAAELVGAMALATTRRLMRGDQESHRCRLTDRQRDCVLWAARGKTDWEISRILGISHETVIQHLKEARDRYNVRKRSLLIVCALFDGLICFTDIFRGWQRTLGR